MDDRRLALACSLLAALLGAASPVAAQPIVVVKAARLIDGRGGPPI